MLRSSLLCLALLGGAVTLHATSPVWASSWADSLFDDVARDFGSVPRGPLLSHHFRVTNKTKDIVHIANVRVSCGCVTAQALETTLAPGKETAILATMDTRRFFNSKAVTIYVQFDHLGHHQPQFEEVRLWLQANSRDDIAVLPEALAFGKIKRGSSPATAVTVSFLGHADSQIVKALSESNYVQLAYKEISRSDSETAYQLSARLRPDAPPGKWYSDVWVSTNDSSMPKVRVPLTVEIEASPLVPPKAEQANALPANALPSVSLGMMWAGALTERKVIIRGAKPFRITSMTVANAPGVDSPVANAPGVDSPVANAPGSEGAEGADSQVTVRETDKQRRTIHVLTFTLRPTQPGILNRTLRVHTDLPESAAIEFQTKGQVMP